VNYDILVNTKGLSRNVWLTWRQEGIGGSDVPGILGISSFSSPLRVYLDKTTPISDDTTEVQNEAMRQGHDLEEYCASRFEEATGKKVRRVNAIIQHPDHPFVIADLDRRVDGEDAILECKTTNAFNGKIYAANEIPEVYQWQCHHYLLVTGAQTCYLAVLVLGTGFYHYTIERDEELLAYLLEKEKAFWALVESGTPPDWDGSPAASDILKQKYPGHLPGVSVELSEELARELADYSKTGELIKRLEIEREATKQRLLDRIGEAEFATFNGETVARRLWVAGRETLDSKKLRAEKPEIYEQYVKQGTGYARLEIKEV